MNQQRNKVLSAACKLGRGLLENGGEIYRVEESIDFFLKAYDIPHAQIFAIPSSIMVTILCEDKPLTQIERVKASSQNLDKLEKLNTLTRRACKEKPDIAEVLEEIAHINKEQPYSFSINLLAYGFTAAFFCLFWGGGLPEAVVAFICGIATKYCLKYMTYAKTNIFFTNLVSSAVIAYIAIFFVSAKIAIGYDKIIIGAIMNLVPGVAITNVMRDIIAGDIITGTTKLSEVLLVATAIAIGIAMAITSISFLGGML